MGDNLGHDMIMSLDVASTTMKHNGVLAMKRNMTFDVSIGEVNHKQSFHLVYNVNFSGVTPERMADMLVDSSSPRVRLQTKLRTKSALELSTLALDTNEIHVNNIYTKSERVQSTQDTFKTQTLASYVKTMEKDFAHESMDTRIAYWARMKNIDITEATDAYRKQLVIMNEE